MEFKFKKVDEPYFTSDKFYDLFDGGYIDPEDMLTDDKQVDKLLEAMNIIEDFLDQAEEEGVIELG